MLQLRAHVAFFLSAALLMACSGQTAPVPVVSEDNFPQSVASGDPTPSSVVLWTRIVVDGLTGDTNLKVIVARDEGLTDVVKTQSIPALAQYDHAAKVQIDGLDPSTFYWYRFEWSDGSKAFASHTGRTKTAPAPGDDATVRFAYFDCQDFKDRWYNPYAYLVKKYADVDPADDLDFVEFLGDYIYETTGGTAPRKVSFEDTAGAIELPDGSLAAASLANYRTLYKTYRSDPMLQRLHERYPVIATWDDHEFSDNAWQDNGTYFDGRADEASPDRKRNAEQAFFEYMPTAAGLGASGTLQIEPSMLYPNTQIWGEHRFGKNVDMILTDYRTYRPDFLVPMNAFPGQIVLDASKAGSFAVDPYVNIDASAYAALRNQLVPLLTAAYAVANGSFSPSEAQMQAEKALTGNVSAVYINGLLMAAGQPPAFDAAQLATLPAGLALTSLDKVDLYSKIGSNYLVDQDAYHAYAQALAADRGGPSNIYGADQTQFLQSSLTGSTATWKVVTSSVSTAPILLDFTNPTVAPLLPPGFPDALKRRFAIDADGWDGFPIAKEALVNQMSNVQNAVLISGDIHASFVTDHGDRSAMPGGGPHHVFDFTGPAVSSASENEEAAGLAVQVGLTPEEIAPLARFLDTLQTISAQSAVVSQPSKLDYVNSSDHGFVVGEADATSLTMTYYLTLDVGQSFYDESLSQLNDRFSSKTFVVKDDALSGP